MLLQISSWSKSQERRPASHIKYKVNVIVGQAFVSSFSQKTYQWYKLILAANGFQHVSSIYEYEYIVCVQFLVVYHLQQGDLECMYSVMTRGAAMEKGFSFKMISRDS